MNTDKQAWANPLLTVHGTVASLTLDLKYKEFGGADDVIVAQQMILKDAS
jgi:hypothetical protein